MYVDGTRGLEENIPKAVELFENSLTGGYMHGYYSLGIIYEECDELRDLPKAFNYFAKSAELGYDEAQLRLGTALSWFYVFGGR